jgi:hypothetical protein
VNLFMCRAGLEHVGRGGDGPESGMEADLRFQTWHSKLVLHHLVSLLIKVPGLWKDANPNHGYAL